MRFKIVGPFRRDCPARFPYFSPAGAAALALGALVVFLEADFVAVFLAIMRESMLVLRGLVKRETRLSHLAVTHSWHITPIKPRAIGVRVEIEVSQEPAYLGPCVA